MVPVRAALFRRLPLRQMSTKEELWKILHPTVDTHKEPTKLWQQLHPLPTPKTGCGVKQVVFEEKMPSDLWKALNPLPTTTKVPDHHITQHGEQPGAVSKGGTPSTHSGWSASHATEGGELWKMMHPHGVSGITFRPRS
mmetsp:Transcript_35227/g.86637  ORF Transcript_35227/g.86637 Transcript_35227/m.86637 type:complete len:139 (+) Transcript_35227:108-524(+)